MKKKSICALAILLSVSLLAGCGNSDSSAMYFAANGSSNKSNSYAEEAYAFEYTEAATDSAYVTGTSYSKSESGDEISLDESAATDRKLIKNVSLEVETKEYDAMMQTVEAQVLQNGGYIENMDSYNGSNYSGHKNVRYAYMTIRIPQDKLNSFLGTVSEVCNVVRRNDSVNDVTLTYVDTASRRDALVVQQERLLSMLEQCETLEDMLTLEERLTEVRYQLESLEKQLRSLDNKVSYSTVTLNISEVEELTPVIVEEPTNLERIRDGFNETLDDVINSLTEFCIWFIVNLPRLIIWAVVILIAVLIGKKIRKKRKAGKRSVHTEETASSVSEKISLKDADENK